MVSPVDYLERSSLMIIAAMLGMTPAATAHGIGSDVEKPFATVTCRRSSIDAVLDFALDAISLPDRRES